MRTFPDDALQSWIWIYSDILFRSLSSPVGWKQSVDIFRSNLYWNRDSGQDQGNLKTVVYYKITRFTTLKLKKSANITTLGLNEKYKINWN